MPSTLLLTGGTGQVGRALLPRLLEHPERRVLVLLRAPDADTLRRRLEQLRAELPEPARPRLEGVAGDVTLPGLGLSPGDRERVLADADGVVHSAASVRFDLPDAASEAHNLQGTVEVLGLARALAERGRLERLDHVSTCYVAGDREGLCLERELDQGQGFRNSYERSKLKAELRVREAMAQGLPAAVHRLAIVVGDSRTGRTQSFNVVYWPLKLYLRGWWRTLPGRPDARVDMVPCDFVAEAMRRILDQPGTLGRTFHLAAGPEAPTIGALMEQVRQLTGGPPLRVIDQGRYRRWVRPLLTPFFWTPRGQAIRRGGEAFLPYLERNPVFDVGEARSVLGGLEPPPVGAWLETVLRYAMERDFRAG